MHIWEERLLRYDLQNVGNLGHWISPTPKEQNNLQNDMPFTDNVFARSEKWWEFAWETRIGHTYHMGAFVRVEKGILRDILSFA